MLFTRRRVTRIAFSLFILAALPGLVGAVPATEVRVLASQPDRIVMEVDLGDLDMVPIDAEGRATVLPMAEGLPMLMEKGAPQLPVLRKTLLIDDLGDVEVRVLESEVEFVPVATISPSKGHMTRDKDPSLVPFEFGPVYRTNSVYPAEEAILHEPFILRDFRGVVVELRPVRYNAVTGQLAVAQRMVIEVAKVPGEGTNPLVRAQPVEAIDREFASIYAEVFENWEDVGMRYTMIPEPGRCLILTADQFYDQVLPLYEWHLQKGIPTILTQLSEVGSSATAVQAYIQGLYDEPEGITYIVLVGDAAQMPYLRGTAENAPSDPTYVKLAGSDDYPDAFISRLSASNATHVETQVSRSIRYELEPDMGGDWYHKATGIASNDYGGGAYDWQRADWLRTTLLGYTYTEVDQIYAPSATKQMIRDALNEGRGLVNYIGHGGTTSWVTTGFNNSDVHGLNTGFMNPYICSVACVNGDFTYSECFAEAWLRSGTGEEPNGAIAVHAASTNASWVPPCDMQTETVRLLVEEVCNSLGALAFNGVMYAMDEWPGYEGTKLMEQYCVFGDCTIMMRSDTPAALTVQHAGQLSAGETAYDVTTPGVYGARAALYADGVLYGVAFTDGNGFASIPVDPEPPLGIDLSLTVTAYNRETVVHTVPTVGGIDAFVSIADYDIDEERVVAGEPTTVSILLHNAGSETAPDVSATMGAIGRTSTVEDSTAQYGDIDGGASVWGLDDFSFTPDPGLPDGSILELPLEINTSTYLSWDDTLRVPVSAPVFVFKDVIVDDTAGDLDGRADGGEQPLLTVGLINTGSAAASNVTARIACLDPRITIIQPNASLSYLPDGGTAYLDTPFEIDVSEVFTEGEVTFILTVTTARGRSHVLGFALPVGGYFECVEYDAPGCRHEAPVDFVDEWHISDLDNVTPGGQHAWKCGADDGGYYAPLNDARLITPVIFINDQGHLSFWHRMDAEYDTGQTGVAFDGGVLEISVNGGPFEALVPDGGYDFVTEDRGTGSPFEAGTPCFSGNFGWTKVDVDLSAYAGAIQICFRFGSDGEGGGEGWLVDDIDVHGMDTTVDAPEFVADGIALKLSPGHPNPFNPRTRIDLTIPSEGAVRLLVLDPTGRVVRTLVDGVYAGGQRSVIWDGRDDAGRSLPSGVYYSVLNHKGETRSSRLVMLK